MKEWDMLIWIPQFGISVVFPMILFIMLAEWLYNDCGWGGWVIWAGILFGLITSAVGFRDTVRAMLDLSDKKKKDTPPGISFNNHD